MRKKFIPISSLLFLSFSISFFSFLFSCKGEKKNKSDNKEPETKTWYIDFSPASRIILRSYPTKLFIFTDRGEIYSFSATGGWGHRIVDVQFDDIADIIDEKTLITKEGDLIILDEGKKDLPVDNPFYFVSLDNIIFYRDGKIIAFQGSNEYVVAEVKSRPEILFGIQKNHSVILLWNSNNTTYWKDIVSGKSGIFGESYYEERVSFYFSPAENLFIAYTSGKDLGIIDESSIKLYLEDSEFKDFSFEVRGEQIILKLRELPLRPDFTVKYKIMPKRGAQIYFDIFSDGENLLFVDMELSSEISNIKFCTAYIGWFDGQSFRRSFKIPELVRGCRAKISFVHPVFVISLLDDFSYSSRIFFGLISSLEEIEKGFWNELEESGLVYPILIKGSPYIIYVKKIGEKYSLELVRIF